MPYYDRFDIIHAHYVWNLEHHGGQSSPEYAKVCRIEKYFKPGFMSTMSENAQAIHAKLCRKAHCSHG